MGREKPRPIRVMRVKEQEVMVALCYRPDCPRRDREYHPGRTDQVWCSHACGDAWRREQQNQKKGKR